jgi:hypothetical protein
MKEQIEARINELKGQLEEGNKMVGELEAKRTNLMYTLLRINGAIQVLVELVQKEEDIKLPNEE